MTQQPNIVLIMVDQMRFDALGKNGNPIISTPNLDMMADQGYNFDNAYAAVPSCIPSRAALHTGLAQEHHGRVGYQDGIFWQYPQTLGSEFTKAGYQTEVIGKMHVYPERNRLGFEHVLLHDGYLLAARNSTKPYGGQFEQVDDYLTWFKEKQGSAADLNDLGLDCNSWVARPWMYQEALHPTNWVVSKGIEFLKRRDPTQPFFLNLSFVRPHAPLDPPEYYFRMYLDLIKEFPEIPVGDWAKENGLSEKFSTVATKGGYSQQELNRMRAGYYGAITHIDHQIGRFLMTLEEQRLDHNTIILFLSDHGDQLGDHHYFRKALPYQGSIHIPFLIYDPGNLLKGEKRTLHDLVEIRDVFPTLIEIATGEKIPAIDGKSLKPQLTKKTPSIRQYLHGEHSFGLESSQYILTQEWKYIWFPVKGTEQLFNLAADPNECQELSQANPQKTAELRELLIQELTPREEGFVKDGQLVTLKDTKATLDFLQKITSQASSGE